MTITPERDVPHYTTGGLEVISILQAKLTPEQFEGFLLGNALKYLFRYQHKGKPLDDLQKASTYVGWLADLHKDSK